MVLYAMDAGAQLTLPNLLLKTEQKESTLNKFSVVRVFSKLSRNAS